MRGKTIQVFLTAEITSNIELAVFIPRNQINKAVKRDEVTLPGVYFLFGKSETGSKPIVYIGQSRDCLNELNPHEIN